jgi:hypothetical protein
LYMALLRFALLIGQQIIVNMFALARC